MRTDPHLRFFITAILCAACLFSCDREPSPKAGTHTMTWLPGESIDGYLLWIPEGYDRSRSWPLLLALREAGWWGGRSGGDIISGPARVVETMDRKDLAFLRRDFLILSPRFTGVREEDGPREDRTDRLMELVDDVTRAYHGDPRRVYLTGTGGGECGVWVCLEQHPDRFAAAAPLGGLPRAAAIRLDSADARSAFEKLPIWIIENRDNPAAPSDLLIETVRRIEFFGGDRFIRIDDPGGLRETPRARRILSIRTPEKSNAENIYENPRFYRWLLRWERGER
ncbi:MAG: hypothetical protein JW958_12950 [Candidatus Eisenbacteria bacterium]|nr:hypothetical protein [Candidatus Eisenbacteria bacterium]